MAVEYKDHGKTGCTACPRCGESIDRYASLAKHIRHGDCSEVA